MRKKSSIFSGPVFSNIQIRVRLVVTGVLLVLAAISFIAYRSITVLIHNTQQIKHSNLVVQQMQSMLSDFKKCRGGAKKLPDQQ